MFIIYQHFDHVAAVFSLEDELIYKIKGIEMRRRNKLSYSLIHSKEKKLVKRKNFKKRNEITKRSIPLNGEK